MLKLLSGKILQKLQQKEKKSSKDHRNKNVQSFKSLKNLTTRSSNSPAEHSSPKTKAAVRLTKKKRKVSKPRTKPVYRRKNNGNITTSEEKMLQSMYKKGSAAFGSVQNLQKRTNLQPRKVKQFLANKNAHTKYKGFRKNFARLKVFAYDINEIWSLDLAHVDKLPKQNAGLKFLLIAVDCLSRFLRVEQLKSKYATTTAEAFKQMIKQKQPKKVWVYAGLRFIKLSAKRSLLLLKETSAL